MKKLIVLLLLVSICTEKAFTQRSPHRLAEEIPGDYEIYTTNTQSIEFNDKVYIVQIAARKMLSFDGANLTSIDFPVRDGVRLEFFFRNIENFGNSFYLLLTKHLETFLYRFDGIRFYPITLPGEPISNLVVFQGLLYVMVDSGNEVKLLSYDGVSVTELSSTTNPYPNWSYYALFSTDQYLYTSEGISGSNGIILKRFDGSDFRVVLRDTVRNEVSDIQAIPGTEKIYIKTNTGIYYFDGTTTNLIYSGGSYFETFIVWNNKLYFNSIDSNVIYKHDGNTLSSLTLPNSSKGAAVLYEDRLYIPTRYAVFAYDGTSFSDLFSFPHVQNRPKLLLKNNDLIIFPDAAAYSIITTTIYSYRDSVFTEIIAPTEASFRYAPHIVESKCFRIWGISAERETRFAKEDLFCSPSGLSSIIPQYFREYERVEFDLWGRYPDWCWTDIIFDWEIDPICPIPEVCPDRLFQASLTGPKRETVWQQQFEKPLKMSFPVEGKQPYTFSLASLAEGEPEDLFIMDDDLVTDGFTGIHMTMAPKKDYFRLRLDTEDNKKLPFKLMLLNEKGETVWQQEFMAPMDEQIKAEIKGKVGTTLRFASISEDKNLRDYGITRVNHYPNAFAGKLKVEISTVDKKKVPLSLTIYDAKGNQVLEKQMVAPLYQSIELYGKKEGLYILELKVGKAIHAENIILKY